MPRILVVDDEPAVRRVLVMRLQLAGYQVICAEDGEEAVIDFKYGGEKKYRELLESGRAVQLATYAHTRSRESDRRFPAVGYLVLSRSALYTPGLSRLLGEGPFLQIDGPAISEVWERFKKALSDADGWMRGEEPVPARPLMDPVVRPEGTDMVIEEPGKGKTREDVAPCLYCDFKLLCGVRQLT